MNKEEAETQGENLHSFLRKIEEKNKVFVSKLVSANGQNPQQSISHLYFHLVLREEDEDYDLWLDTQHNPKSLKP